MLAPHSRRLHIPDQIPHLNVQSIGDDLERSQRHALLAGFNPVQMHAVQPRQLRQLVLRHAFLAASRLDISSDNFLNVLQRLQAKAYAAFRHPA